jgi:hypothetical protein
MAIKTITVLTKNIIFGHVPGPHKPGSQVVFSDDLLDAAGKRVGSHSGFGTLVRELDDRGLIHYQATYEFAPGPKEIGPQITARGLVFWQADFVGAPKVAITGGTEDYANARGQVTWTHDPSGPAKHTLAIEL